MQFKLNQKGQSALEYLMTYGWALVVMVIVVASLVALDVFNLSGTAETCAGFSAKLGYKNHIYFANGDFNIVLNNATGDDIELKALKVAGTTLTETDLNVSKGSSAMYGGKGAPTGTAGKSYKVSITVTYDTRTSAGAVELPGLKTTATCLGTYNG